MIVTNIIQFIILYSFTLFISYKWREQINNKQLSIEILEFKYSVKKQVRDMWNEISEELDRVSKKFGSDYNDTVKENVDKGQLILLDVNDNPITQHVTQCNLYKLYGWE